VICTDVETIKSARKPHRCSWCGERIEAGSSYFRWRCYDGGDASTCRMHGECKAACESDEWVQADGGEFSLYDNERPTLKEPT
jgi:predicted  nucleic acid-binding Zn-ribbon protein